MNNSTKILQDNIPNTKGYLSRSDLELWTKVSGARSQADPFSCRPIWNLAFHEAYSPKRHIFIQGGLDGLAVMAEKHQPNGSSILTPVEPHWFFGSSMIGEHSLEAANDLITNYLSKNKQKLSAVVVSGVRPRSKRAHDLRNKFEDRFTLIKHSKKTLCAASLKDGFDGYLSRRSRNTRKGLKRAYRKAQSAEVSFERKSPNTVSEVKSTFDRMIDVEMKSWKGAALGMATGQPCAFYRTMMRKLAQAKQARVIFAKMADQDIGYIFGGVCEHVYRGQQFSFARSHEELSLGNLLQAEKIRWLCEDKIERYDMGPITGRRMGYKAHWAEKRMHIETDVNP
jgi:predicted N-acyltransferase